MKKYLPFVFGLLSLFCCNQTSGPKQNSSITGETPEQTSPAAQQKASAPAKPSSGNKMIFKAASIVDKRANMEVARLFIPKDWKLNYQVTWRPDNDHFPCGITATVTDATGEIQGENFADKFYLYSPGAYHFAPTNLGATYVNEVPEPKKAVLKYLIYNERRNVQGLRVVDEKEGPQTMDQGVATVTVTDRIEYMLNGKAYQEKIEATYHLARLSTTATWVIDGSSGIRAPKGQLNDDVFKVFKAIEASFQFNHDWEAMYVAVRDNLIKQVDEKTAEVRAQSIITQQVFDHNTRVRQEGYEKAAQIRYDANEKFDDHLNGVESRHDLQGNPIKVTAGYEHKYISSHNDEVILSNDPLYDPNKDPSLNDTYTVLPP